MFDTVSVTSKDAGISFLICTFNGASRIAETLTCLAQQAIVPGCAWEVILVDNASTDNTAEQARLCWQQLGTPAKLHTLYEARPGKNFALEQGFQQARYRYVCTVDDDNRLAADYMRVGVAILETNPQVGLLGGRNTASFEINPPTWFAEFQRLYAVGEQISDGANQALPLPDGSVGRNVLWGAGMFVRATLWQELGKYNFQSLFAGRQGTQNLTAGEDDELCYAAQMLGYEIWYSSKLHLRHHMAAGRLTETYRNRLYYSTAWATARLSVYRNILWAPMGKKPGSALNLLKDILYMAWGIFRQIMSPSYIRALWAKDIHHRMECKRQFLVLYDFAHNFRRIISYYTVVENFKKRAEKNWMHTAKAKL